jgi:hypothetical protein
MTVKIEGPPLAATLERNLARNLERVRVGMTEAANQASTEILERGRADISGAGQFGNRWTSGLTSQITEQPKTVTITVRHAVPYWSVFQYGKTIRGKPLLWIPLSFAREAQGVRARDFPGRLFRVDRKAGGAPLLLSAADKQPKYHGQTEVTIPKKFHLVEICHDVAGQLGQLYRVTTGR